MRDRGRNVINVIGQNYILQLKFNYLSDKISMNGQYLQIGLYLICKGCAYFYLRNSNKDICCIPYISLFHSHRYSNSVYEWIN